MATKRKSATKGRGKVAKVMREYKGGGLKSGSGRKVKSRKQAIAIALNEARESGAKIPRKGASKKTSTKRTGAKKSSAKKTGGAKTARKSSAKRSSSKRSSSKRSTR